MEGGKQRLSSSAGRGRGAWRLEEDLRLRLAVQAFDTCWAAVARAVGGGRSDVSCRERWCNALRHGANRSRAWDAQEERRLAAAVSAVGLESWKAVAERMEGRDRGHVPEEVQEDAEAAAGSG